jgi:hypothetical protein
MVEEMPRKSDNEGADKWLRIIVAIGELERQASGTPAAEIPVAREAGDLGHFRRTLKPVCQERFGSCGRQGSASA